MRLHGSPRAWVRFVRLLLRPTYELFGVLLIDQRFLVAAADSVFVAASHGQRLGTSGPDSPASGSDRTTHVLIRQYNSHAKDTCRDDRCGLALDGIESSLLRNYEAEEGEIMNCRAIALVIGIAITAVAQSAADSAAIGTWKQNLSRSKYHPGPAQRIPSTLRIEAVNGGEKLSVDGVGADGKPASWSYTATYDGKPTPVTGSPYGDTVALKRIDAHTSMITYTRNGKVSRTSRRAVSKDGKTMTISAEGTTANGQNYNN